MDCVVAPTEGFQSRLFVKSVTQRIPISGIIELTFRCNYNCLHCYVNLPSGDRIAKARELTTVEWKRVLDEMAAAGCLYLLITGGEIMIHPDWQEIYLYAKRLGMLVTLYTNGSGVTPAIADFLVEYPPERLEITLYGATREVYERVTRLPGSYDKALRGIKLLLERKIPLALKSVALRANLEEMHQMRSLTESLGLDFFYDPHITVRIDGQGYPLEQRLQPWEVVALDMDQHAQAKKELDFCTSMSDQPPPGEAFSCGAGLIAFTVDPFGVVSTCQIVRKPGVDLRQHSFDYAWNVVFKQLRELQRSGDQSCDHCDIHDKCTQCGGWSMLEHDDYETPIDWLCDINHARHEAFNSDYQPKAGQRTILLSPISKSRKNQAAQVSLTV